MTSIKSLKYYGKTADEYSACKADIEKSNGVVVQYISVCGIIALTVLCAASFVLKILDSFRYLYLFTDIAVVFIFVISRKTRASSTLMMYAAMTVLYAFSVGLALAFPTERATVSAIMLPLLSAVMIDRFDRVAAFDTAVSVIYGVLVFFFKAPRLVSYEIFTAFVSLCLALVSNFLIQRRVMNGMLSEIRNVELKEKLKQKSETDGLSGLLNRETFVGTTEKLLSRKDGGLCALCIIDIDFFKSVNDTYGHQAGDDVLIKTADIIKSDFSPPDAVGRIGGDEFMIYMCGEADKKSIAEKLGALHEKLLRTSVGEVKSICTSIGVAVTENGMINFEEMYRMADNALYKAKAQGRNMICFFGETHKNISV